MTTSIQIATEQLIVFVLSDTDGLEVSGLADTFTVAISKNGGALQASAGVKAEIGSGWYSYELTAGETGTTGPLAIKVTGTGVTQQNLLYQVVGTVWAPGSGPYILTVTEAAKVLRCAEDDDNMLMLLPLVDSYIKNATGHDWAADTTIRTEARAAAQMLITMWYENPAMTASGITSLNFGLQAMLVQLEALALSYREFLGRNGAGGCVMPGVTIGDSVTSVIGLIGLSGDQASSFETVITVDDQIQQISGSDLSTKWFRAFMVTPGEL